MRRARSNLCDSWFARDHMQPRRRILSRRRCPHGAADRWMARCVAAWPSLGMREYALQLASTPRTTDQAMGISRRAVRQANGSAYLNDLQRKDNERGKRASGCAHKAGKRRDGNLVRCIGCDKVVGLWRAPQATTRRAVRRPSPVLPVVFDMDDPNNPLAAVQFALDRLFRPEVRTSKKTDGRKRTRGRARPAADTAAAPRLTFELVQWWR